MWSILLLERPSYRRTQTVILDCCHSGSGTRKIDYPPSYLEREYDLEEHTIPANLDDDLLSNVALGRAAGVLAGFSHAGSRSHVLLSACREREKAGEDRDGGLFTRALLEVLRTAPFDRTTYRELVDLLPTIPE